MRPIRLSFAAFGSYEKKTTIDFRELRKHAFFLIHGATGAGKTTILDAICFALYGDASGENREVRMLRNEQAGMDEATWVELDFMLGEKHYFIWRSPEQLRLKKRGEGTTISTAEALLYAFEGEEKKLLVEGYLNVTAKVEELLGFKSSQFRQVVLLPQGEFLRLLLAKSNERQEIMEVLFNTEIYRGIEEGLKKKARDIEKKHEEIKQRHAMLLVDEGASSLEEFALLLRQKEVRWQELQEKVQAKQQLRETMQQNEQQARQIENRFVIRETAEKEAESCKEKLPDFTRFKERYETAERAAALSDIARECRRAEDEYAAKRKYLEEMQAKQATLQQELKQVQHRYEAELARDPLRKELEKKLNKLVEYRTLSVAVMEAEREVEQQSAAAKRAMEQKKTREEERTSLDQSRAELQIRLSETMLLAGEQRAAAMEVENLQKEQLRAAEAAEYEKKRQELAITAKAAQEALKKDEEEYSRRRAQVERLQHLFAEGQAALLAAGLQEHQPCPVCGSREHPCPAISQAIVPDEAEIKDAQAALQRWDERRKKTVQFHLEAENMLAAAISRAEQSRQQLCDVRRTPAVIGKELAEAREQAMKAVQAVKQKEILVKRMEEIQKRLAAAEQFVQTAEAEVFRAEGGYHTALGALQEKRKLLPEEYRDSGVLQRSEEESTVRLQTMQEALQGAEKSLHALQETLAALNAAKGAAEKAWTESMEKMDRLQKEFVSRRVQAGFATAELYEAALAEQWSDGDYRQRVKQHIRDFEDRYTAAQAAAHKAVAETEHLVRPDLEAAAKARQAADNAWTESYGEAQKLSADLQRGSAKEKQLQAIAARAESIGIAYRSIGRLSEVANGKNVHGITFQRYVLRSLLHDVIDAANERLLVMSRGQYQLQPGERARKNMAGGLDIEVFDEYTGYARSVATLSGGESFLASLSLALGLADVVQSYAGGIRLDTIFIDEGFGTLDSETLDVAIDTLIELQKSGRLVGIISHVEELREHIGACLEVSKTRNGSTARFIVD